MVSAITASYEEPKVASLDNSAISSSFQLSVSEIHEIAQATQRLTQLTETLTSEVLGLSGSGSYRFGTICVTNGNYGYVS